jgi:hypothetical protein
MHVTQNNNTQDIVENWDHPISLFEGDNLYKLLEVVALENNRIDLDIEEVYDDKFLESATGQELEKIGDLVGVDRKTAEGDEKLRKRIQAEFIAQASDTTYETFASATLSILGTNKNSVSITTPPQSPPKVVSVDVDGGVIDDNPLSKTEIAGLLDKTVSADAKVNLVEKGTFAFAGDDDTLKGWDEGTWSSTIN